jgi:hypothetical protein
MEILKDQGGVIGWKSFGRDSPVNSGIGWGQRRGRWLDDARLSRGICGFGSNEINDDLVQIIDRY